MAREIDDADLDALLRSPARAPEPAPGHRAEAEGPRDQQLFADVWARLERATCDETSDPSQTDVYERRWQLLTARDAAARRRRLLPRLTAVALALAVTGGGAAAAAEYIATRTGVINSGWSVQAGGSGEFLDLGGSDLNEVRTDLTADITFPPGYEEQRASALDRAAPHEDPGPDGFRIQISSSNVRQRFATSAVCSWADAWVAADDRGDVAGRQEAGVALRGAVTWEPFVTGAADFQEPAPAVAAAGATYRWWLRPLADAAEAGDRAGLLVLIDEAGSCTYRELPVIDLDPGYPSAGVR